MTTTISLERIEELQKGGVPRLLAGLYDEAIAQLHIAIVAVERGQIQVRCNAITGAIDFLGLLSDCVDLSADREVAENLLKVHGFIITRLPQVNLRNDAYWAEKAIALLEDLRDAWAAVDLQQSGKEEDEAAMGQALRSGKPQLSVVASPA